MVEFRLYYDDNGDVLCYSSDGTGPNAKYMIVDSHVYAEGRIDIKIINGIIMRKSSKITISKMIPDISGTRCSAQDINIIVDDSYDGETMNWKTKTYEYGS